MKYTTSGKLFISLLLCAAMLFSVLPASLAEETAGAADAAAAPVLLGTVNGTGSTDQNGDYLDAFAYYESDAAESGTDTSGPEMQVYLKMAAMESVVRMALYRQKIAELNVPEPTAEELAQPEQQIRDYWNKAVEYYMENFGITEESSEEEIAQARASVLEMLEGGGFTEETFVADQLKVAALNLQIRKVQDLEIGEITVTEEEISDQFNELVEEDRELFEADVSTYEFYKMYGMTPYFVPEGYRGITRILLKVDEGLMNTYTDLAARLEEQQEEETADEETTDGTVQAPDGTSGGEAEAAPAPAEEPVTPEMVEAARQAVMASVQPAVDEIMEKFNAGTAFADLIAEYGTDPDMMDEANLSNGYAMHRDSILWDPAVIAGAMALEKIGDVSEPLLNVEGVHILYYLRDIPSGAVEMTGEIKEDIRAELLEFRRTEAVENMLNRWMEEADIQYTEAGRKIQDDYAALMAQVNQPEEDDETPDEEPAGEEPAEENTAETPAP